jgi:hypothetical protein
MPYISTGRPVGRPKTKEYSTLLARVPQELINRVKDYCNTHNLTISELIRDGLEQRMAQTEILYSSNTNKTSIPKDMISKDITSNDTTQNLCNTQLETVESSDNNSSNTEIQDYDTNKYILGKLCPRSHEYKQTGKSLLRLPRHVCIECDKENARERRRLKKSIK